MADLATDAVTVLREWEVGARNGERKLIRKHVRCVLTGQGGTTNEITASALGLSEVHAVLGAVTDGNTIFPAVPKYDLSAVLLAKLAEATDANRANPQDLSDTIYMVVEGV